MSFYLINLASSTSVKVNVKDLGTQIGPIKTPQPKAEHNVTTKGIPTSISKAGTGTSTSVKVNTSDMGTKIGAIKTPQPKAEHTVKGVPTGTPSTTMPSGMGTTDPKMPSLPLIILL